MGGAPLDDELMFRAANHITAGQWLGAYDYLTLSKAMFFPVWLALLHALHLPYLISGAALWCGAALLAAFAFSTLWRKKDPAQGRVLTLGLFAVLAFLPSSWAAYTLRVYRDNILSGAVSVLLCGHGGHGAARGVHAGKAALAVAGRGGRGSGLRLSGPRGRRAVPAAVCRGGHRHCGRGAGGQAPLEGSGCAGHPVCHASASAC